MSSQNTVLGLTVFVGVMFALIVVIHPSYAQPARPNIIYIMADDLGYADLSCYGRQEYQTPHLDRLASQGVKFLNAYAAAPICTPTRAAFITGLYPARTPVGLYEPLKITPKDSLAGLETKNTSIASRLQNAGYETVLIGKWHLGFLPKYGPNANGFDQFFGFHPGAIDYISHNINDKPALYENSQPLIKEGYMTDLIAARATEYIKGSHSKPFFLSLQFNAPHWPWQVHGDKPFPPGTNFGPTLREGGSPATFAAMMKSLDDAVGAVMKAIEDAQLLNNTVVIFTSDNGGEKFSNMGPYSGKKGQLKEGGIRVPAFIRWPGVIPEKTTTDQAAITMDWSATILEIAGARPDAKSPLDGVNLLPLCMGKQKVFERTFYWRTFQAQNQKAIRQGKWKYLKDDSGEYLFDLTADMAEKNDLKIKFPSEFESLKNKYEEWEKTVLKPVPL